MVIRPLIAIVLAAIALAAPAPSFAQSERGSITGVIQDTSKAAVPGVSVKVVNTATNSTTDVVSSESGAYSAVNLPPGTYRIEASLTGFQTAKTDGIRLAAGATARVDIVLNLGAIEETVTVMANSPLVSTEDAKITTNMSNESIDQLPLVVAGAMRSVFDLVATVPESKGSGTQVVIGGGGRRRHHLRFKVGDERVPWLCLQFSPQRRPRPERILRGAEGYLPAKQLRRLVGWAGADPAPLRGQEPDVFLRGLRRFPEPLGVECADPERADA